MAATFQMLDSHIWLVAIILDSTDREHFHISESSIGQRCTKDIKMSRQEKTAGKEVKEEER